MLWMYSLVSDKSKFVNCWKLSALNLQNVKTYILNDSIYLFSGNEWEKNIHRTQCRGMLDCLCCTKHKHYTPLHSNMWSTVSSKAGDHSSAASRLRGWGSALLLHSIVVHTVSDILYMSALLLKFYEKWPITLINISASFVGVLEIIFMSGRPSLSMEQLGSNRTDFNEIWNLRTFRKFVDIFQVSLRSDKNNGWFTWRPMYIYGNILLSCS
jgi:hypothetical protein